MKHVFSFFKYFHFGPAALIIILFGIPILKPAATSAKDLNSEILKVIQSKGLQKNHLGLLISSENKNIFQLNADKKFIPASVTKLITAYAVLKTLPLNYKFKTELFLDHGNLYIKGGGDPSFVSENMWYLVNEFVRQNISFVNDLVVDETYFDQVRYDSTRESVRVDRSYDAPVGALSFNWNSVNIYIKPGLLNQNAEVILDPANSYFKLINRTRTNDNKSLKDLVIDVDQDLKVITVSGDVFFKAEEKAYFKNVADPSRWTAENLKFFLSQRNIQVKGKIKIGAVPLPAKRVAFVESKSVSQILIDMNKFSNNFVAEMLTKNLAGYQGESPATLKTGLDVVRKYISELNLSAEDVKIINPSGFSRENQITARGLNKILESVKNDFLIYSSFLESLPILGIDGTLKKRMKNSKIGGYVRGKTGYLDGVITLSGFAGRRSGELFYFTFLYNGPQDMKLVQESFDQVLLKLLE